MILKIDYSSRSNLEEKEKMKLEWLVARGLHPSENQEGSAWQEFLLGNLRDPRLLVLIMAFDPHRIYLLEIAKKFSWFSQKVIIETVLASEGISARLGSTSLSEHVPGYHRHGQLINQINIQGFFPIEPFMKYRSALHHFSACPYDEIPWEDFPYQFYFYLFSKNFFPDREIPIIRKMVSFELIYAHALLVNVPEIIRYLRKDDQSKKIKQILSDIGSSSSWTLVDTIKLCDHIPDQTIIELIQKERIRSDDIKFLLRAIHDRWEVERLQKNLIAILNVVKKEHRKEMDFVFHARDEHFTDEFTDQILELGYPYSNLPQRQLTLARLKFICKLYPTRSVFASCRNYFTFALSEEDCQYFFDLNHELLPLLPSWFQTEQRWRIALEKYFDPQRVPSKFNYLLVDYVYLHPKYLGSIENMTLPLEEELHLFIQNESIHDDLSDQSNGKKFLERLIQRLESEK